MRTLTILILAASLGLVNDIAKINKLKSEAQKSYLQGDYQNAVERYRILVDSFQIQEEGVLMNYANAAYFLLNLDGGLAKGLEGNNAEEPKAATEDIGKNLETAQIQYTALSQNFNTSSPIRSSAYNQLGVMSYQLSEQSGGGEGLQEAKEMFKSALRINPQNEDARFNYELVSKMLEEQQQNQDQDQDNQQQQDQDQQQQDQNKEQQDQQNQEQQNQEQQQSGEDEQQEDQSGEQKPEESEQKEGEPQEGEEQNPQQPQDEQQQEQQAQERPTDPSKIEEMKISEEKAKMILEAMKNAEVQYIQQNKRKSTKKPDSGKPDW